MTGASSGGATVGQGGSGGGSGGIMEGAGASGHQGVRTDGGPGGIGGTTGGGIGGYCGTGCYPTYGPLVDAGQLTPCGPTGPVPGQRACESACGPYRAVRWRDFADTYACYYDRAGNLVSGRVMGTCSDPADFQSGPDVMCPGGDGGGDASFDAASGQ